MKDTKKTAPAQTTAPEKVPFDRSICFTFFADYAETLDFIKQQNGTEAAYAAFEVLVNYCLYGEEPQAEGNPWGLAWPIV